MACVRASEKALELCPECLRRSDAMQYAMLWTHHVTNSGGAVQSEVASLPSTLDLSIVH